MQVYAHRYPDEIYGLVLLDPSPLAWMLGEGFPDLRELFIEETMVMREASDAMSASMDPDVIVQAVYINAVASEFEEFFGRTASAVAEINSFDALPLVVIGATEPDPNFGEYAKAFRQFWNEENQTLTSKSEKGKFILASGSSHHIHLDAPQVVIDAIIETLS
jgi:pimeloyl-ACP methyl ester carboxylesterase